ncbi:MAG: MAPEG family protein [Acidobacteria bacterium]|nr:MAPEG family protein [Acidobacteriota bacterium]
MLLPMFAMVALTFLVMIFSLGVRFHAVKTHQMKVGHFKVLELSKAPPLVAKTTRHLANLFEFPVLFYVACLTCRIMQLEKQMLIGLAWAYVLFRLIHASIHITTNAVMYRMTAFLLSNATLIVIWAMIAMQAV